MPTENLNVDPACEIVSSRVFQWPRATVYRAWADPDHLKSWWGPAGFTNTFNEFDLRVGGRWDFTMHGPEKGNYHNQCEFTHIVPPVLIAWKRHSKPLFRVRAEFDEIDANRTKVLFRMIFDSVAECDKLRNFVPEKNEENFDRLESELARMSP